MFQRTPIWVTPASTNRSRAEQQEPFERDPAEARKVRDAAFQAYEAANFGADSEHDRTPTDLARELPGPQDRRSRTAGQAHPVLSGRLQAAAAVARLVSDVRPAERDAGDRRRSSSSPSSGLRTADGVDHEFDTVIYGTGFHAADYLGSLDVYGTGGRRLRDDWRDGAEAYLGTVVPGYPNLFTLYGPNTNGVTSIIYILEAQAEFVRRILDDMAAARGARRRRQARGARRLQRRDPAGDGGHRVARQLQQLLPPPQWQSGHPIPLQRNHIRRHAGAG